MLFLLVACSGACVCPGTMARPLHQLSTGDSLCSSNIVMEGHHEVWTESGCEMGSTGWRYQRTATDPEVSRVETAFAQLPDPGQGCDRGDGGTGAPRSDTRYTLSLTTTSGGRSAWIACQDPDGGLAPPFDEAVSAVQALAPR